MRILAIVTVSLLLAASAAYARFNGCPPGFCPGLNSSGGGVTLPTGKILLVDGTSFLLKVDGTSKVCRAGGC